jgi:hypothetical protein
MDVKKIRFIVNISDTDLVSKLGLLEAKKITPLVTQLQYMDLGIAALVGKGLIRLTETMEQAEAILIKFKPAVIASNVPKFNVAEVIEQIVTKKIATVEEPVGESVEEPVEEPIEVAAEVVTQIEEPIQVTSKKKSKKG